MFDEVVSSSVPAGNCQNGAVSMKLYSVTFE
jgi:hypothetical protein